MDEINDFKTLKEGMVQAMALCCMLQFERNLIRSMRKETLDPIIAQTIGEIESITKLFTKEAFSREDVPPFIRMIMERMLKEIEHETQVAFVNNVYKLYAEDDNVVELAKILYSKSNQ